MPFFYVDWYYIVLVLPAVILSLWASAHVKSTFRRYSQVRSARGMTGRRGRHGGAAGAWRDRCARGACVRRSDGSF